MSVLDIDINKKDAKFLILESIRFVYQEKFINNKYLKIGGIRYNGKTEKDTTIDWEKILNDSRQYYYYGQLTYNGMNERGERDYTLKIQIQIYDTKYIKKHYVRNCYCLYNLINDMV